MPKFSSSPFNISKTKNPSKPEISSVLYKPTLIGPEKTYLTRSGTTGKYRCSLSWNPRIILSTSTFNKFGFHSSFDHRSADFSHRRFSRARFGPRPRPSEDTCLIVHRDSRLGTLTTTRTVKNGFCLNIISVWFDQKTPGKCSRERDGGKKKIRFSSHFSYKRSRGIYLYI